MSQILAFINDYLDPLSIVVGLIVTVPIFWTWWSVTVGAKRRHARWFGEARTAPGKRAAILIVDLLPRGDVRAAVENYRQQEDTLKAVPNDRIFHITRTRMLTSTDMLELNDEIRSRAGQIVQSGADVVHYFYAGPLAPNAMVGAELANTCRVIVYQRDTSRGTYENWGPLRHRL